MKRLYSLIFGTLLFGISLNCNALTVEPPYWWTGMTQDTLQLMLSGKNVGQAQASINYPGVRIAQEVKLDNPDYLILYLVISPDTKPGSFPITLKTGKKSTKLTYTLRQRKPGARDKGGFDSRDVLYLVMPDRFASDGSTADQSSLEYKTQNDRSNPSGRHGGNIQGLRNHLNYIDSLGVTAVWVNPVLTNDMPGGSYHGYATTDYYNLDPRFGTNQQWNEFVEDAHSKGLKVVMDMIFNHSGSNHPWNKNRPSADWINFPDQWQQTNHKLSSIYDPYASDHDRLLAQDGWFVAEMPDLNQRNPHLMNYLIQNSIWWIESSEIDGIRMDTYPYADEKAMARWIDAVEKEYPNFNIVGECWLGNEGAQAFWQKGSKVNSIDPKLPTVMDFTITDRARNAFSTQTTDWGQGLNQMYDHLAMDFLFEDPSKVLTFLDNHDTDRFLHEMPDSLDQWKQALTFLLTTRGIPQLYYGTELLMNGTKARTDGDIRLDFPGGFPGDSINAFTREGRTQLQNQAVDFLTTLLNFRKSSKALTQGSLKHFSPQGLSGAYVYERRAGEDQVIVIMNGNDREIIMETAPLDEIVKQGDTLTDILTGQKVTVTPTMQLKPRALYVLH